MAESHKHLDPVKHIRSVARKFDKPHLVIVAWQDEAGKVKVTYNMGKMKLRAAFPAVFTALSEVMKKAK